MLVLICTIISNLFTAANLSQENFSYSMKLASNGQPISKIDFHLFECVGLLS